MSDMNPPAFPWAEQDNTLNGGSGMSLRDWFAGQALPTLIDSMMAGRIGIHPKHGGGPEGFAASAYEIADAMLAARTPTDTPDPEYTPRVFAGMGRAGS